MNVPQEIGAGVVSAWAYGLIGTIDAACIRRFPKWRTDHDDPDYAKALGTIWPFHVPVMAFVFALREAWNFILPGFVTIGRKNVWRTVYGPVYDLIVGKHEE